jgi:hypothetical protein
MGPPWSESMLYCPNCSAYQYEENAEKCRKCGYDMASHRERECSGSPGEDKGKKETEDLGSDRFENDCPCPLCESPTRMVDEESDVIHEGGRINMHGLKLMGGEITKKTLSLYRMRIKGIECSKGHRFYLEVRSKKRALCPLCQDPLMEYGSSLYSCTRCNRHFSLADWEFPEDTEVLERNGWIRPE